MLTYQSIIEQVKSGQSADAASPFVKVYPQSLTELEGAALLMVRTEDGKRLLAVGDGPIVGELEGEPAEGGKLAPLTHANRLVLNRYLPYTAPQAFGTQVATFGLGDRLGLASPGHIRTVLGKDVRPILAQQSIRELALTGRTYEDVLDAACYAVFQEGYRDGFGADGDHLKKEEDIEYALRLGFTMLTLDCSENIDNTIAPLSASELEERYAKLPQDVRAGYEERYLANSPQLEGAALNFTREELVRDVLIYHEAINFMERIYRKYIEQLNGAVDFEISIDETETPTSPEAHFLVANELYLRGIQMFSMAPRFCGEFQKGIDYIGDIAQFERELQAHAAIADHFGYKLSIHSGSDKFSVFPLIGQYTRGRFHVKTAGTNWLEAVRVVAQADPALYRRMHQHALDHFEEATAYYHVTTDISAIRPLSETSDAELPDYMNENNARQLLHITYGILLQAKNENGNKLFADEFFALLNKHEDDFAAGLGAHIGKHLTLLGK
ncbi:tagaturonate epimerase [Paenibacillus sp. UNCCL117]|uniref:tagaturonate epimerase family protein n=1 Tax=unclassified Paenibacillus TaxID=185978 RepID=UPI00088F8E9A|nr:MULTISPECIES: tagaturonate epimerase family protein [unclassified Paenibacillus]SDD38603.1 tagaturonate epimerase [Paenibacillus sp. cl123]SFW48549.1 tagaturonate epimerase [Paenibacillus sp. UNCCL117]